MNTNIKITLTDAQRNVMKRRLTGKDTKAMISRAELNELVQDYINDLLAYKSISKPLLELETKADRRRAERDEINESLHRQIAGHDDCCRANELLRTRINALQHRLDRMVAK